MNKPDSDTLASVLASVIGSDRSREEIQRYTGLAADAVDGAVRHLANMRLIQAFDGRRYHATQGVCAGPCSRGGRTVRGTEVVISSTTLRWMCAPCWDGRTGGAPALDDSTPADPVDPPEPQPPLG